MTIGSSDQPSSAPPRASDLLFLKHLATGGLLLVLLYLMYAPTFLTDYLMNDEWAHIGWPRENIATAMMRSYFAYGRGLFGLYEHLVYSFAGYSPARVQLVRFINFASLAAVALLLLRLLQRDKSRGNLAFFTMLFWVSEPPFQGLMGYSLQLISNTLPSIWLSLTAFYLFFFVFDRKKVPKGWQWPIVLVLLLLAMQSTQTFAFIALVPITYLALTDWAKYEERVALFLLLSFLALLVSIISYKIGLQVWHSQGSRGYRLGEEGAQALATNPMGIVAHAVDPRTYWSAFKVWTFPFPLHNTAPLRYPTQVTISMTLMFVWLTLIGWSMFIEITRDRNAMRRIVVSKWLAVFICCALSAVFLLADSPFKVVEHRPHLVFTLTGVIAVSSSYSLSVLSNRYWVLQRRWVHLAGAGAILLLAFGAQAGVLRNIVDLHMRQLDFVRSEALSQAARHAFDNIIVVPALRNGCVTEPCGPWTGHVNDSTPQSKREGGYRYALATVGISPKNKRILFLNETPAQVPDNCILIDWNKYSSSQLRYAYSLRHGSGR